MAPITQGMGSVFFNKGENCIAAGRLFVEDSIHDEFVERVIEEIKKMKIGDPLDGSTDHGPQNHRYEDNGIAIIYLSVKYKAGTCF